jgi:hypothetical protein
VHSGRTETAFRTHDDRRLPAHSRPQDVRQSHLDVAYLEVWIAVDADTPALLEVPPITGRYYTAQLLDDVVAQLIRDVGFEPIDAGPLRITRYLEPFTLAIAQLAYEGNEGPELAYRIERFGK